MTEERMIDKTGSVRGIVMRFATDTASCACRSCGRSLCNTWPTRPSLHVPPRGFRLCATACPAGSRCRRTRSALASGTADEESSNPSPSARRRLSHQVTEHHKRGAKQLRCMPFSPNQNGLDREQQPTQGSRMHMFGDAIRPARAEERASPEPRLHRTPRLRTVPAR